MVEQKKKVVTNGQAGNCSAQDPGLIEQQNRK
jgi:hypothetical protein